MLAGFCLTISSCFVEKEFTDCRLFFAIIPTTWLKDVLQSLGTGLITSVILIYGYDFILMRQDEKDKATRLNIVIDKIYKPYILHIAALSVVKKEVFTKSAKIDMEFFNEEYFEKAKLLDLNSQYINSSWLTHMSNSYAKLNHAIDSFLNFYKDYLSIDIIEKFRETQKSKFGNSLDALKILLRIDGMQSNPYYFGDYHLELFKEHIFQCISVINELNKIKDSE